MLCCLVNWNQGNGYEWRLDVDERKKLYTALVRVALPDNVNKKNLLVQFEASHLRIIFKVLNNYGILCCYMVLKRDERRGKRSLNIFLFFFVVRFLLTLVKTNPQQTIIDGELHKPIKVKDSTWMIETEREKRFLIVELSKRDNAEHWPTLLKGEDKVIPEPEKEKVYDPNNPLAGYDIDQLRRQQEAASGSKIKVRSVDDMQNEIKLQNIAAKMPEKAQESIREMLDFGMSATDVYNLVLDALKQNQEASRPGDAVDKLA